MKTDLVFITAYTVSTLGQFEAPIVHMETALWNVTVRQWTLIAGRNLVLK